MVIIQSYSLSYLCSVTYWTFDRADTEEICTLPCFISFRNLSTHLQLPGTVMYPEVCYSLTEMWHVEIFLCPQATFFCCHWCATYKSLRHFFKKKIMVTDFSISGITSQMLLVYLFSYFNPNMQLLHLTQICSCWNYDQFLNELH